MRAATHYFERSTPYAWVRKVSVVVGAMLLIAFSAPLKIPLFFTPVPMAVQVHVILALSIIIGPRMTGVAVLGVLAQAAMGLPVLSGTTGLFGPTAGYLVGYLIAAFITGSLAKRKGNLTGLIAGNGVIYALGFAVLSLFVGWKGALLGGVLPFIPGDALKLALTSFGLRRLHRDSHFGPDLQR